ncbi:MAG: hypothetical protein ACK5U7_12015 [Bacteroidota bacterium]
MGECGTIKASTQENSMKHWKHTQHPYSDEIKRRLFVTKTQRRCEAAADYLLALAIGCGLAALLVAWWSS